MYEWQGNQDNERMEKQQRKGGEQEDEQSWNGGALNNFPTFHLLFEIMFPHRWNVGKVWKIL